MAQNTHVVGGSVEKYVLMAILAAVIAGIMAWLGYDTVSEAAIMAAIIAAISAGVAQYTSTGSIPGTAIPIATLIQLGIAALFVVLEHFAGQTSWTVPTILSAVVLFLGTLLSEVQSQPSAGTGTPTSPPATQ